MGNNHYHREIKADSLAVWTGYEGPCEVCEAIGKDGRGDHRFTAQVVTEPGHDSVLAMNVCRMHAEQLSGKVLGCLLKFITAFKHKRQIKPSDGG